MFSAYNKSEMYVVWDTWALQKKKEMGTINQEWLITRLSLIHDVTYILTK